MDHNVGSGVFPSAEIEPEGLALLAGSGIGSAPDHATGARLGLGLLARFDPPVLDILAVGNLAGFLSAVGVVPHPAGDGFAGSLRTGGAVEDVQPSDLAAELN